jgi:NTP pyrophosphatase (non-canonical NTP hydrolase)
MTEIHQRSGIIYDTPLTSITFLVAEIDCVARALRFIARQREQRTVFIQTKMQVDTISL